MHSSIKQTKCKICAPFAILGTAASFEKMNDAQKCQSGLAKKDPKNLGCVMRRNLPRNDTNNRLLWTVENNDIIKILSDELKRSFVDVAAFLYELNYSNFRKVLLQSRKHESRTCRIPLCEPDLCDHYAEIFDDYGNLRQPKQKEDLQKLLCLMRNEFSKTQAQEQESNSNIFSIIGLKRKQSNGMNKDCYGLCDPLGCTQQRRKNFYNIDGKYSNKMSGEKLIGYDWSRYGNARKVMRRASVDKKWNCFSATDDMDDHKYNKKSQVDFGSWDNGDNGHNNNNGAAVDKNRFYNYETVNGERINCGVFGSYKDFLRNNILGKRNLRCGEKNQSETKGEMVNGKKVLESIEAMYNNNTNKNEAFDTRRLSPRGKELVDVLRSVNKKTKLTNNVADVINAVKNVDFKHRNKKRDRPLSFIDDVAEHYTQVVEDRRTSSINLGESKRSSSRYRRNLKKDGRSYYGEPVPVLVHKPFDNKKPWTWMRRHPNQERLTEQGSFANSRIRHYRRISEEDRYRKAQERTSVRSTFSRASISSRKSYAMFGRRASSR